MNNLDWFENFKKSPEYLYLLKHPIAYFCTEYALNSQISIYAGGLGVLSGDFIKEADQQRLPLVAIGLYYHQGYIRRQAEDGKEGVSPDKLGLKLVTDTKNNPIVISVPIQDRTVHAQAWEWKEGPVRVYLLETNIPANDPSDRHITNRLYTTDKETRLEQEMIMGIGGYRLLKALGISPSLYHLNEGHSAFLTLELVKDYMEKNKADFIKACGMARNQVIFTNHTLLPAGRENFNNDLVSAMLSSYAESLQVPVSEIVSLGLVKESSIFSMTLLSLQLSTKMNAVSALHAREAAKVWSNHPMDYVTNGIFLPRWDRVQTLNPVELWERHQENKKALLATIKSKTKEVWNENNLLVGWARRIVPYKRPLALFENINRLKEIAQNENRPVRLVFSGLCHGEDPDGDELFRRLGEILTKDFKGIGVFLPGYDLGLAKQLVAGCDLWLNTPVVKSEACGTSGMKAALNGVLPISTKDGWIDEVELFGVGWMVDDTNLNQSILDTLEKSIIPMYYQHWENPPDSDWLRHMRNAREMILNQFSTTRVLREYLEKMYLPILKEPVAENGKQLSS